MGETMKEWEDCIVCGEPVNERTFCIEFKEYFLRRLLKKGRVHQRCLGGLDKRLKMKECHSCGKPFKDGVLLRLIMFLSRDDYEFKNCQNCRDRYREGKM